ncbi:GGDEF domain-containing protein [Paenibacillus jiagnxiensis]|uniref:GGDEF domain-containing protein n=1 Tax=Paenibacillus jiagnxiensis TaxID=3228926 RepID=UPI0033A2D63F
MGIITVVETLIAVLLLQALVMYRRWGHPVYLQLASSYAAAFIVQLIIGLLQAKHQGNSAIILGVTAGAFLWVQMSIYRYYHTKKGIPLIEYLAPALIALVLPTIFSFVNGSLGIILTTLFILAHAVYCFYYVYPAMQNRIVYAASMFNFAGYAVAATIESFMPQQTYIASILLLTAYAFVFLLQFNRVLDVLQGVTHHSMHDDLTGLFNQKSFMKKAFDAAESGQIIAVVMIDIDGSQEDDALRQVAEYIQNECQGKGFAGRYGREGIAAVFTQVHGDPFLLAERIRGAVEKNTAVTVSMGYARYEGGLSAEELLNRARKALDSAKNTGQNKVVKFVETPEVEEDPEMSVPSQV